VCPFLRGEARYAKSVRNLSQGGTPCKMNLLSLGEVTFDGEGFLTPFQFPRRGDAAADARSARVG